MRSILRNWLKPLLPAAFVRQGKHAGRILASLKGTEQVFTEIYRNNQWGGADGEICSGGGSSGSGVAGVYQELMADQAVIHGFPNLDFVDLGCGDMAVGRSLIPLCNSFTGVDIVKYVVDRHQRDFDSDKVRFVHLDIIRDALPAGDVCFLRQVLQHLSNRQILAVLPKLAQYRLVYITEHVPTAAGWVPNLDKPHGRGIRLDQQSGVDLAAAPFNLPANEMQMVLEVPGNENGGVYDPGMIRTILYTPGNPSPGRQDVR